MLSSVDFPNREGGGGLPTARNGALSTFFGFSCRHVAATAPRGTYLATRHHKAFRIERRANHSTHARHRIPTYHTTAFFFPCILCTTPRSIYIYIYISLCSVKCLSPRYRSRDALLQYVRAVRWRLITYSLVSFFLHGGPLMFNLSRALTILFMRGRATFLPGYNTGGSAAREDREKGTSKPYY